MGVLMMWWLACQPGEGRWSEVEAWLVDRQIEARAPDAAARALLAAIDPDDAATTAPVAAWVRDTPVLPTDTTCGVEQDWPPLAWWGHHAGRWMLANEEPDRAWALSQHVMANAQETVQWVMGACLALDAQAGGASADELPTVQGWFDSAVREAMCLDQRPAGLRVLGHEARWATSAAIDLPTRHRRWERAENSALLLELDAARPDLAAMERIFRSHVEARWERDNRRAYAGVTRNPFLSGFEDAIARLRGHRCEW